MCHFGTWYSQFYSILSFVFYF
ncbi:Protein CBG25860 [Caenorhabditis briggsae]|uniref:Protein CBG25860 n=1 Tax=Caenorhabditis briggsae TaxID=6238 RepID=B6IIT7_CAEBR|nr:Protein CBG25860 [Caenorhabditis briggsae]CAR99817.1 Protein CBG25860 [Caenorhabditis briggsae]